MESVKQLLSLDFPSVILGMIVILLCIKFIWELLDWVISKLGIELRVQREKRQNAELFTNIMNKMEEIDQKVETINQRTLATEVASREALAERINSKYKEYFNSGGIPEDEVDEFVNLHTAYKGVGGNHSSDIKFNYCMDNLPILPSNNTIVMNKIKQK